jgi:hypothetical protein
MSKQDLIDSRKQLSPAKEFTNCRRAGGAMTNVSQGDDGGLFATRSRHSAGFLHGDD